MGTGLACLGRRLRALAAVLAMLPLAGQASIVGFTDRAAFDAAVAALPGLAVSTEGFDTHAAGTTIPDGGSLAGLTYTYGSSGNDLAGSGVTLRVSSGFGTTSPSQYLGTSDGGVLQAGDDFALSFEPARALGLYFISADPLLDGDITLGAGGVTVGLSVADEQAFGLPDGKVYFLGLLADAAGLSRVEIRSGCAPCGAFLFNIDDVVVARVPVPATWALALAGLALLGRGRSRDSEGHSRRTST